MATTVGIEGTNPLHFLLIVSGALNCHPSPCNVSAAMENIVCIENKWWLAAAARDESGL